MVGYSIIGDDDSADFFYVHPENGDVTLLGSVFEAEKKQYRVRTHFTHSPLFVTIWSQSTR